MKCQEDAVGEEIKSAVEKDQEIIVRIETKDIAFFHVQFIFALSGDCVGGL